MPSLIDRSPAADILPVTIGQATLEEVHVDAITWVAPYGDLREIAPGLAMPKPNQTTANADTRAIWVGAGQALVLGNPVWPGDAAVTDQSDGWTIARLRGDRARDILARVTPLDLRDAAFPNGATARTLLGHMTASVTRIDAATYDLMVFRSMAQTLVHDMTRAMRGVLARETL